MIIKFVQSACNLPFSVVRATVGNHRRILRFILVPVIIFVILLNLDEINRKKNDFFDKKVYKNLTVSPKGIRAPVAVKGSSHQKMNQKGISIHMPQSNVLQKIKHSKKSLPKNNHTESKDRGKKNTLRSQASEPSWTKWLTLLKSTKANHEKHLLVIVTTWVSSEEKQLVHENVARLWAYWPKLVQPIVYLLPSDINKIDQKKRKYFINDFNILIKNGWLVRPIPRVSCGDVPVLKFMIMDAKKLFPKSDFYGFANSDILFDSGLIETLKGAKQLVPSSRLPVLLLGQRTNLNVTRGVRLMSPGSVLESAKNGSLMKGVAIDYFITNDLFPWDKIPDIVVGRIHYDNWMIYFGISQDAIVIDATRTLTALHQTTADGNAAGWGHAHRYCNKNIIEAQGKPFHTRWGYTWCAPYTALRNPKTGSIGLKIRRVSPSCNPRPPPFVLPTEESFIEVTTKPKIRNVGKT